jgi:hypothetical protein
MQRSTAARMLRSFTAPRAGLAGVLPDRLLAAEIPFIDVLRAYRSIRPLFPVEV